MPCTFLLRWGPLMLGDPSLPLCMRHQRSRGSALGTGPPMWGDPSLLLCMRHQRSRGSALRKEPLDPLWEGTPYALVYICSGGDPSWERTPPYLSLRDIKEVGGPFLGGDPIGWDPSLPVCMRYQGSREFALGRDSWTHYRRGPPIPLYIFTQEGTPHGRGPLPTSLYEISKK